MKKLQILFEDDDLIFVNKPPGLLSIPDRYDPEKENLQNHLKLRHESIFTFHRLDKDTSGVIGFAKNEEAHKNLSEQFEKRRVEKKYLVIVKGHLDRDSGEINKAILPHPTLLHRMIISQKGKPSLTSWKRVESFKNYTLLEVQIKTGRTHQIRVHFESIGYPLAIDPVYSGSKSFFVSTIKQKRYRNSKGELERPLMSRTSLHSHELSVEHPKTKEIIKIEAPLPKDFRAMVNQLRKWGK